MDTEFQSPQRIVRLTPLADVTAAMDRISPVAPRQVAVAAAVGRVLASDIRVSRPFPKFATALRDGFAVNADATADASAYAPIPLAHLLQRVDAGDKIPAGCDAVAPLDTILISGGLAQAITPITQGDGVLPSGADADVSGPLLRAGHILSASTVAALTACDVATVQIREPRIGLVPAGSTQKSAVTLVLLERVLEQSGCRVMKADNFAEASAVSDCDAIVGVGGTGTGRDDTAAETLARSGQLIAHGIGVMPGHTSAFGLVQSRPALLLPGRIDDALAAWLTLGATMIARLYGTSGEAASASLALSRKVTSTIGIADVVLVRRSGGRAEPLAWGYWPMQAIAQADGYIVMPPQSEGHSEGTIVAVRPLP